MFEFTIGFKVKFEFTVWISKLWPVDITIKIMTVGSKKKMTVDRRHRFNSINSVTDSSNTVVRDIDLVTDYSNTVVGDIDSETSIRWQSSETSIRWQSSETSIWWWSSETSIWRRSPETLLQQSAHRWWRYNGRRHQSGRPSDLHHKRLYWPSHQCW